jgi:uncharacterized membrane protein YiaA
VFGKSVRDRVEGLPVSALYVGLSWSVVGLAVLMLAVGLWNSGMAQTDYLGRLRDMVN